jgi:sugar lactone lactonase YvrE
MVIGLAGLSAASAQQAVTIAGEKTFPESVTSTADGTLYTGSLTLGAVFKAAPGAATAEPFIEKDANGLRMVLGVLADEASGSLWLCSSLFGDPNAPPADLKTFDLASGAAKATYTFPAGSTVCNDIAIGPDGTAYATSTTDGKIFAVKPGATEVAEWASDPAWAGGLDGIAIATDGKMYVNHVGNGTLFSVEMNADGSAGAVTQVETSQPLQGPDGMRPAANGGLWVAENAGGRISHVGTDGAVHVMKEGLESPTAMTQVGDTVWYIQTKFAYFMGDKKDQDPGPFTVDPISAGGM